MLARFVTAMQKIQASRPLFLIDAACRNSHQARCAHVAIFDPES